MTCRQKKYLYLLVIILENLISYKRNIINMEIELVIIKIKGKAIIMNFNILLLGNNKVILGILWLQKYNLKIN